MAYEPVTAGDDAPNVVNVIIEIQKGGGRNKYEFDKKTGRLTLDRVNGTTLGYPADYGYIPDTLCDDGDPLDVLLIVDEPIAHGVVVPSRPIGIVRFVDDGEADEKLICVPAKDISKDYIKDIDDYDPNFKQRVEHFYTHYKDWKNNWTGVKTAFNGWGGADEAKKFVQESIARAKNA